ncbi:MAG: hypothetical protein JRF69_00055 [Deltaproteobacteria bacterium]|nr:hypothetical protein [Deltaproteobacteria bacterium]
MLHQSEGFLRGQVQGWDEAGVLVGGACQGKSVSSGRARDQPTSMLV